MGNAILMVHPAHRMPSPMYTAFFGLQALPFNLTPDPAFLFLPPKHREAVTGLSYAILERKGFVVLTGDAGTGKTTLLNCVLSQLPETQVRTSVILNPALNPAEFLEGALLDFGITDVPASKALRLWKLQEFLATAHQENQIVVLIIDEAHKLPFEVLEEIRLLGNYEFGPDKFLQIILIGQCELDELLNRHELRQLKQRIGLRLYIDPLRPPEVSEYIAFRWLKAGGKTRHPFTPVAITSIFRWSRGVPRLINCLCDNALLMAYAEDVEVVGGDFIRAAAVNLALAEAPAVNQILVAPEVPAEERALPREMSNPPLETAEDVLSLPTLSAYGGARANSSLLRRLAGKFGLPH
jgi:general secretion pathway protein A